MSADNVHATECFVFKEGSLAPCSRELVAEEPLSIHLNAQPLVTLMRTPGNELDLALGFLLTEGVVRSPDEVGTISFCASGEFGNANVVRTRLASGVSGPPVVPRHRRVFSSCGICGAEAIEEAARDIAPFQRPGGRIRPDDVFNLADAMHRAQGIFRRTGGAHAAALAQPPVQSDSATIVREDLGRHNALDKVVGAASRRGGALESALLVLSGRLSFEMVAKAARVGISDVAGVSAPSALAVQLAATLNMFVAGFVRGRTMTVYSGAEALRA